MDDDNPVLSGSGTIGPITINNSGQAAFGGRLQNDWGVYVGDGQTITTIFDGLDVDHPVAGIAINDSGQVAFSTVFEM